MPSQIGSLDIAGKPPPLPVLQPAGSRKLRPMHKGEKPSQVPLLAAMIRRKGSGRRPK